MAHSPSPLLHNQRSLAAILQVRYSNISEWRKEGMPYIRMGARCIRFDLQDVMAWLKSRHGYNYGGSALEIAKPSTHHQLVTPADTVTDAPNPRRAQRREQRSTPRETSVHSMTLPNGRLNPDFMRQLVAAE